MTRSRAFLLMIVALTAAPAALAQLAGGAAEAPASAWPSAADVVRALLLRDYNTRVVVLGVMLLGAAGGLIGSFLLLRKRALLSDALSHATLPGIGVAFLVMVSLGGEGKWLPGLLAGATVSGVIGVLCALGIVGSSRIKEDAALGIVLSVFFGIGAATMGIVQNLRAGNAAGLQSFIYGKTASMLLSDAMTIAVAAAIVALLCALLFKEFGLVCFDPAFARAMGRPVLLLDIAMTTIVVAVTVIGLQAVGLILMVAMLVIPAAAARFWTNHLPTMLIAAAALGAASGYAGAAVSALAPRLPAGAVIVLVAGLFFGVSMFLAPARGVLPAMIRRVRLARRVARQHLLRALYELGYGESADVAALVGDAGGPVIPLGRLRSARSWSPYALGVELRRARRGGLVRGTPAGWALTRAGHAEAWRITRNHRLWELYLIAHADIAPSHVDRDADAVEHVLDRPLLEELERELARTHPSLAAPASPHDLPAAAGGAA